MGSPTIRSSRSSTTAGRGRGWPHGSRRCSRPARGTPLLDWTETARHPHNAGRGTYRITPDGFPEPGTAPRFLGTPSAEPRPAGPTGSDTDEVLTEVGTGAEELAGPPAAGVVG
ncbi:hypothetical protein [Streptomyces sp. NPDC048057]|uniref:hypothetical protein n=1 Tax=Streptomyces sp. NPDC048057 TaxID=3155628 RepID=UPI0033EB6E9F